MKKQLPLWLLGLALLLAALLRARVTLGEAAVPAGDKPVANPLKGYMVPGEAYRRDPLIAFACVPVYWDELEPQEGCYDFAALEERCHFARWRADGVRLVLRLVLDTPGEEARPGLPQWLYDAMEGAGTWYDGDCGKGFSPDYTSPVLQAAHRRLVAALGARYGSDPQVAFVELGSLGHWGAWFVEDGGDIGTFPPQSVTDGYVQDYLDVFGAHRLLVPRPCTLARDRGLGLYNDSFGLPEAHEAWLARVEDGYTADRSGTWMPGMPDFWYSAPSGGKFSPRQQSAWYFSDGQFFATLDLLRRSHTTFLESDLPRAEERTGTAADNLRTLSAEMGYTLGVRSCRVERGVLSGRLEAVLTWQNTGLAPLYGDWPIALELQDSSGSTVWSGRADSRFSRWGPGLHTAEVPLAASDALPPGDYTLWVGIVDPLTDAPGVALQMDVPRDGALYQAAAFSL